MVSHVGCLEAVLCGRTVKETRNYKGCRADSRRSIGTGLVRRGVRRSRGAARIYQDALIYERSSTE